MMHTDDGNLRNQLIAGVLALAMTLMLFAPALADSAAAGFAFQGESDPRSMSWRMYWEQFKGMVFNTFNNRTRMIQLACVGMVIGLFIMFRSTSKHTK